MKKFNKEVRVSVDADQIGQYLLSLTDGSTKAEAFIEAVVGYGIFKDTIGGIFMSALTGNSPEAKFAIGDECVSTERVYDYSSESDKSEYRDMGLCKIINVNVYSEDQYEVEYIRMYKTGPSVNTEWVNVNKLTLISKTENLDII
jgi:hypothetical protein